MNPSLAEISRRRFLKATAFSLGSLAFCRETLFSADRFPGMLLPSDLPRGGTPAALDFPHFPDRLHACVWRNWQLVPIDRLAKVLAATSEELLAVGRSMGLAGPPTITSDQQCRSSITVIKRNWHLLPYSQLLDLLGWTPEQLAFTLREDDFLFGKLGGLKPQCEMLQYGPPSAKTQERAREITKIIRKEFPGGVGQIQDPLFSFVARLSAAEPGILIPPSFSPAAFSPRFCYSYFALYGDPLLKSETDPYPDGYLAQLAAAGVDGVWLQAVLYKLAPFAWEASLSVHYEERLTNLRALVQRASKHGIRVYLYLNEPRAMPADFFNDRQQIKGVTEEDHAALCTSVPEVQQYLVEAVASICRAVPKLGGFFSITASENLTNCWSHKLGSGCPRCGQRAPGDVIAEVNNLFWRGIRQAGSTAELIVWDWGWADSWTEEIIQQLPQKAALMSVSEWGLPIHRGGVKGEIGEYSISAVGPGPRARRSWELAHKWGLKAIAKIQAGNTWELSAVPYIPAVANVAQHAANLRDAKVDGLMLSWTLGGYPSPNLEVVAEIGRHSDCSPTQAMEKVARQRFGVGAGHAVVKAWQEFSVAFREFPFGAGLYFTPLQVGPSNLLWEKPSGYHATMVGFPYDDLDLWRTGYPIDVFIGQLEKVAQGFERALVELRAAVAQNNDGSLTESRTLDEELNVAGAAAIHFRSAANQSQFIEMRRALADSQTAQAKSPAVAALRETINHEIALARMMYEIQMRDSRIGFEASNQYYYVPIDLAEKVLNCYDLLARWLPRL